METALQRTCSTAMKSVIICILLLKTSGSVGYGKEEVFIPGTITIGNIIPISGFSPVEFRTCTGLYPMSVLLAETIIWSIKLANDRFHRLKYNITIGAWIRDSCDNGVIRLQKLMTSLEPKSTIEESAILWLTIMTIQQVMGHWYMALQS